jgi:hypothetical protein
VALDDFVFGSYQSGATHTTGDQEPDRVRTTPVHAVRGQALSHRERAATRHFSRDTPRKLLLE